MPATGDKAPAFTLETDEGKKVSLKDFKGRTVVLYFYPKDDTPGCTKEACAFRDAFPRFTKTDAVILGISADSVESHVKFKKKYKLPFTLLADVGHEVADRYGVWGKKKMFANIFSGIHRTTFVIDGDGVVRRVFKVRSVDGHAADVEAAVKELGA